MTTKGMFLVAALFSASAFACAADPNKKAEDAHDAELKADRKNEQGEADQRSDTRVKAAEMQRQNTEGLAAGTPSEKERTSADAKLTEARTVYRANATERLDKADARTKELAILINKAGAKASTPSRDAMKTVETQRLAVTRELEQLPRVANENWQQAKTSLDGQLDTLEGLVKKTGTEVDKFKK